MMKIRKEQLIEKIEKDLEEEEKLKFQFEREISDAKVQKRKGFVRRLQLERREATLDGVVLKAQEVANLQANEIEQEEKLASELGIIRQHEIKDEKLRQHLRENSHELKELECQLRAAYVNKTLAAQIAENKARKAHEEMCEQRAREVMQTAVGSLEDMERKSMMAEKQMKEEYRRTLQDQIIEKERLRQQEYMAFMKEKKLFEDTIKKIRDEEEKERVEQLVMKQKVKEEMEMFYASREMWKARERILIDKENQKLEEIAKMKEKLDAERYEKSRYKSDEKKERLIQQMTQELHYKNKLAAERQDLINTLRESEAEELHRKKSEDEMKRNSQRRNEAKVEFQRILTERERKSKEDKELDAKFARQMNLKIQEEETKKREEDNLKRQRRILDGRYNEEKIKQNVQRHAESLKLAQLTVEFEEREAQRRAEMIQEERIRILREHAPHLLGYFPKGCLTETDLELLGLTSNSPLPDSQIPATK